MALLGKRRPLFSVPGIDWPAAQGALRRKGYRRAGDLLVRAPEEEEEGSGDGEAVMPSPEALSTRDFRPTEQDVARLQAAVARDDVSRDPARCLPTPATQLYQESKARAKVISFCKAVDAMLGGGVHKGQITELSGLPGTGKTQIAMQLAVDARIPKSFRGAGQEAVYIDTEGAFTAARAAEMAQALIDHLRRIVKGGKATPEQQREVEALSLEAVLGGVHVFRVLDDAELLATLQHLPKFLDARPQVGLLVLDSLALPFRQDTYFQTEGPGNTARVVGLVARELCGMAQERALAVVVTNQLTTKVDDGQFAYQAAPAYAWGGGGSGPPLAPTLGDSWGMAPAVRLHLWASPGGHRGATLVKSASQRRATAAFRIHHLGVRDVPGPPRGGATAAAGAGQQQQQG